MSAPAALRRPSARLRVGRIAVPRVSARVAMTVAVATALALVAFVADGGLRLERTTNVEIALMLAGAVLAAAAILQRPGRLHGGWALLGVAALAMLTAASMIWSLAPADSWEESNRTFAYLAVFAAGIALARLFGRAWEGVVHGIGLACVVVCGWALATKVFPGAFAEQEVYARLRAPFDYWNAVGLMAAAGIPPLLWLAARRTGHQALNALAWPGIALLLVCLMLSYSRGALLALAVGLACWFVIVPLRLRSALPLAAATLGAAIPIAWAFGQDDLTSDRLPLPVRSDAGIELGALLAAVLLALTAAGLVVGYLTARRPPSDRARELAGRGLLGLLGLVLAIGVVALATAPGGIDGQVSKAWNQLTDPEARTPANTPDRLTAASSVRARYWREAFKIHGTSKWIGTGAGAYATARTRFRTGPLEVRHAHGYVVQTLADLGWLGLAVSLAALAAWLAASLRATGLRRADRGLPFDAERIGLITLGVVVVVFGVHSLVDWTWFIPANAAMALLAAGFVAGRAPLRDRLGATAVLPASASGGWRERLRARPVAALGAAGVVVVAILAGWAAYQPVRAVHAGDAAIERLSKGQFVAAQSVARIAAERNPLSVDPLFEIGTIEHALGNREAAVKAFEDAVALQPANAEAWRRLGRYRLSVLGEPDTALPAFRAAYFLDPNSADAVSDFLEVQRQIEASS